MFNSLNFLVQLVKSGNLAPTLQVSVGNLYPYLYFKNYHCTGMYGSVYTGNGSKKIILQRRDDLVVK